MLLEKRQIIINKFFNIFFILLVSLTFFISIFFIPIIPFNSSNLLWPAPNYYTINSPFGKRSAPTKGASSFHKGIDIGAPEGSDFIAVTNGTISFVGFLGGGGYTITLTDENNDKNIKYSYCHVNPNFIVSVGQKVFKGDIIGKVGPKYIDNIER